MWPWVIATIAAWQAWTLGPFKSHKSGHTRASWAADRPEPRFVAHTFANLSLAGYDGTTLAGDVELWAADGLDPRKCVPEIVWDSPAHRGARVDHPPRLAQSARDTWHAIWHFEATVDDGPAVLAATAFVFCPIDAADEQPPWGTWFFSIETVIAGPNAKKAYCAKVAQRVGDISPVTLAGHRSIDLGFACGVLPRRRGRDLVDDCTGDVLLALDSLGESATVEAPASGAPPSEEELRALRGGSDTCTRLELHGFDAKAERAWRAAEKKLGKRLAFEFDHDSITRPFAPIPTR